MKRLLTAVLVLIGLISVAAAQNEPLLLRYKFTAGQTDTFVMRGTGTLPLSLNPGPEAMIPAMGFDVTMDMELTTKQVCRSVAADGSGVVEVTFPAMTVRAGMQVGDQPVETVLKWENGVLSTTVNGEAQPEDDNTRKLSQTLAATLTMTVKPTGEQTPDADTVKAMNELYSATLFTGLDMSRLSALTSRLPEGAVSPGATWTVEDTARNEQCTMSGRSSFKFTGLEDCGGTRAARIEGQATMTMNGQTTGTGNLGMSFSYNLTGLEINVSFVNHLDPVRGVTVLSQANMVQNMAMIISLVGVMGAQPVHLPASIENGQLSFEVRLGTGD
jgi:hypothetical protein